MGAVSEGIVVAGPVVAVAVVTKPGVSTVQRR